LKAKALKEVIVNLEAYDNPEGKTICINGMVTLDNCHLLSDMGNSLASEGYVDIIVDFIAVSFIDSAGIGTLVSISKLMKRNGGTLKLVRLNENLRRVLTLSRLDKYFELDDAPESQP
jgi:anti-sigma B factor antagonist